MPNRAILSCDDCTYARQIVGRIWCGRVHKEPEGAMHLVPPELYAEMRSGDYQCMYRIRNPEGSRVK